MSICRDLNEFVADLPHTYKIAIAGNHDRCCIYDVNLVRKTLSNFTYLLGTFRLINQERRKKRERLTFCKRKDEEMDVEGVKIYGSPISMRNNSWSPNSAFQLERNGSAIKEKFDVLAKKYPEGSIDVLITHGPPYGFRDQLRISFLSFFRIFFSFLLFSCFQFLGIGRHSTSALAC